MTNVDRPYKPSVTVPYPTIEYQTIVFEKLETSDVLRAEIARKEAEIGQLRSGLAEAEHREQKGTAQNKRLRKKLAREQEITQQLRADLAQARRWSAAWKRSAKLNRKMTDWRPVAIYHPEYPDKRPDILITEGHEIDLVELVARYNALIVQVGAGTRPAASGKEPAVLLQSQEKLANYAHRAWANWMSVIFEKSTSNPDGSVTIPAACVERWQRQMMTDYADLPETEKESDSAEARIILRILQEPPP